MRRGLAGYRPGFTWVWVRVSVPKRSSAGALGRESGCLTGTASSTRLRISLEKTRAARRPPPVLRHYGSAPRACRLYRAKTKGKVERTFCYVRQDFFLVHRFCNLDDLNRQFVEWLDNLACRSARVSYHFQAVHGAGSSKMVVGSPDGKYRVYPRGASTVRLKSAVQLVGTMLSFGPTSKCRVMLMVSPARF